MAIKEPSRIPYFFKGHFYAIIRRLYKAHFKDEDKLEEMFMIIENCPHKCVARGIRECCGCDSVKSVIAGKPCEWSNKLKHE